MLQKLRGSNQKGFTLIELMIVIAIIGILAAIAIPNFLKYRQKSYNSAANADAKNAYTAAQAYFTDAPDVDATLTLIRDDSGYQQSENVVISIPEGDMNSLLIRTTHSKGTRTYTAYSDGIITYK